VKISTSTRPVFRVSRWVAAVSLLSGLAWAADFPQRVESAKRSAAQGLGKAEIPLLKRRPGPGMSAVAGVLARKFSQSAAPITTRGRSKTQTHRNRVRIAGDGWALQVYGDGTKARYRNSAYLDRYASHARPVGQRLSESRLEALGRQFIREHLQDAVVLGANEALVPFFTEFQIGGGGPTKAGAPMIEEQVVANTVVFSRAVNGTDVVGPGSKIAITFANDEKAVGFDFDWPAYEPAGKTQRVVPLPEIQKRLQELGSVKTDSPGVKVERFECGYFDAGLTRRDSDTLIQAGCFVHTSARRIVDQAAYSQDPSSGHILAAFVDAIPAGDPVEPDKRWRQAAKLLGIAPTVREVRPPERKRYPIPKP